MTRRDAAIAGLSAIALVLAGLALALHETGAWTTASVWIHAWQTEWHRTLSSAIRAVRDQGAAAAWGLIVAGFVYGVLHAAGPGHGKAVIAAYMLADRRRLRQGLALAWAAALVQALTAVVLVAAVVHALGLAGRAAQPLAVEMERIGYGLTAALGAGMLWSVGRQVLARADGGATHDHHGHDGHGHDGHGHDGHHHESHGHADCGCGHGHAPLPPVAAPWWRTVALVLSVGMRPCSGALLVLIFAQALGIFAAGIAATAAMAVGTAITVSVFAALAVGSRHAALRLATAGGRWGGLAEAALGLAAGVALLVLGLLLLSGTYVAAPLPFR